MKKQKTSEKSNQILPSFCNMDFKHYVSIDSDSRHGDDGICHCESICRCRRIINAHVTDVSIDSLIHWQLSIHNRPSNEIYNYCLNRILIAFKLYKSDIWDISIGRGYYGEEIDSVHLDKKIAEQCDEWTKNLASLKNDSDRVRLALRAEYGYLLETLNTVNFIVKTVDKSDVYFGQEYYRKKVSAGDQSLYKDYNGIFAVCLTDIRIPYMKKDRYRVIDGYHRLCSTSKTRIKIITTD